MRFFGTSERELSTNEVLQRFRDYHAYVQSLEGRMPQGAWSYSAAEWHYDYNDHRSPHDSWAESVLVTEPARGQRSEIRRVEITITLLGAYHDGHLILEYPDVTGYSLQQKKSALNGPSEGHGDLIIDEVLWSEETGLVTHEILFERHGHWRIEARDIRCRWVPF